MRHRSILFLYLIYQIVHLNVQAEKLPEDERVDCTPYMKVNENDLKHICKLRGCEMDEYSDEKSGRNVPLCYYNPDTGYKTTDENVKDKTNGTFKLSKSGNTKDKWYGNDIVKIDVEYKTFGEVMKVSIGNKDRYVPPVDLFETSATKASSTASNQSLEFELKKDPHYSFIVKRKDATAKTKPIWNTSPGGFIFSDQFIQIATKLPSTNMYGFGENFHDELKHDFGVYNTWGMFARDKVLNDKHDRRAGQNYYGVHPFYMMVEDDGKAHGVFIFNSNAQDFTTGPAPHLVYRTIGGKLDIFFFPGPTPEQVLQQYHKLIGRPFLPTFWSLGFQLCAFGYKNAKEVEETIKSQIKAEIPIDVFYADIDYMDKYRNWTIDEENWKDLPNVTKRLQDKHMKLILIFDPAIEVSKGNKPFERALETHARFIEWPNEEFLKNEQNQSILTKYPLLNDFFNAATKKWWIDEIKQFIVKYFKAKNAKLNGIWLDMNEPAVFGTNDPNPFYKNKGSENQSAVKDLDGLVCPLDGEGGKWDRPPYFTINAEEWPNFILANGTLCMQGQHACGKRIYDTHNLYGLSETIATFEYYKDVKERPTIVTRSTFPSSGRYAGHWLGDNRSTWQLLRQSVIGAMEFNMFGIPYVGADVCGFLNNSWPALCLRWQQLGAFHSFYRNHNAKFVDNIPEQDPARPLPDWKPVAETTKIANLFRYQHLPYLYSLHFHVSIHGGSVVRPPFFDYPTDEKMLTLSEQFMWGSSIMVVPVVNNFQDESEKIEAYLPKGTSWYAMTPGIVETIEWSKEQNNRTNNVYGSLHKANEKEQSVRCWAPKNTPLPTFVKAGSIIPRQTPKMTTTETRATPFQLLIALDNGNAKGELYWDDGESWVENIDTYGHYHFEFKATVTAAKMELEVTCTKGCPYVTFF
ncbi:glycosyl hydrolases family 31 domain-containing protein [Ditylenchus destructor]|uniref:Glycosyl hydrolases family 31 domain-containing protein n=1 Tax=Ditylenchus destructor TaxID=166010 RepID=A0AAD4MSJ3_9BILA|nr:glycosyl hydrolases family 31 domain-containing protein [Ditylenchus destructor]